MLLRKRKAGSLEVTIDRPGRGTAEQFDRLVITHEGIDVLSKDAKWILANYQGQIDKA